MGKSHGWIPSVKGFCVVLLLPQPPAVGVARHGLPFVLPPLLLLIVLDTRICTDSAFERHALCNGAEETADASLKLATCARV